MRSRSRIWAGSLVLSTAIVRLVVACSYDVPDVAPAGLTAGAEAGPAARADGGAAVGDSGQSALDAPAAPESQAPIDSALAEQGAPYPATCAAAQTVNGTATLYVNGDPSQAWQASCDGGVSYLALPNPNYSTYPAGGCASVAGDAGAGPMTLWSKIQIDPLTLVVNTADYAGSSSTGAVAEKSGNGMYKHTYTQMPYGSARTCKDGPPVVVGAQINLQGTPFAVGPAVPFVSAGFSNDTPDGGPYGNVSPATRGKVVELYVGGYPAGISPCASDYYTSMGGACLQLTYAP